jgi:hypothetical protein
MTLKKLLLLLLKILKRALNTVMAAETVVLLEQLPM